MAINKEVRRLLGTEINGCRVYQVQQNARVEYSRHKGQGLKHVARVQFIIGMYMAKPKPNNSNILFQLKLPETRTTN